MGVEPPVEYLDTEDLVRLAEILLGHPAPIRDIGLLGAAAARPQTTVLGDEAYRGLWAKGAALLHSIVKNRALTDGNKRLGWLAMGVFLEINGITATTAPNEEIYQLVVAVASRSLSVEEIARRLEQCVKPRAS